MGEMSLVLDKPRSATVEVKSRTCRVAEIRKGALVTLLGTRPHLARELDDIVNNRHSVNVEKGQVAAREALRQSMETHALREKAREEEMALEIQRVSKSLEYPRLMKVLERAQATRQRDAVRNMTAANKWDYAKSAAEKKHNDMLTNNQLRLNTAISSKVCLRGKAMGCWCVWWKRGGRVRGSKRGGKREVEGRESARARERARARACVRSCVPLHTDL